jgi:hypothetical protein
VSSATTTRARALLADAAASCPDPTVRAALQSRAARFGQPLQVAIVGATKAGKSTLVNALVGERVAATDASECTRVPTWYQHGDAAQAWLHPVAGAAHQVPFEHRGGRTGIDLQDTPPEDVDRLVVTVPSRRLLDITLVDTPGLGSLSGEASDRTTQVLADIDHRPDAVVVLLRHADPGDPHLLDAFHEAAGQGSLSNTITVLSRADEMAPGRPDSLDIAADRARRVGRDARLRALTLDVVPVSGLLAETAATLTEDEARLLARLSEAPAADVEPMLLSVDRFTADDAAVGSAMERAALVDRFGLTGVRIGRDLVRSGRCSGAAALSTELWARSGLEALRSMLLGSFAARADVLRAAGALATVGSVLDLLPDADAQRLRRETERAAAGSHGFAELRLLEAVRADEVPFSADDREAAEHLLGAAGLDMPTRLRLPAEPTPVAIADARVDLLARWQQLSENPFTDPAVRRAAQVLRRTCEGLA